MAGRRDLILGIGFLLIWILPITFVSLVKSPIPGAGNYLNNLYRLSCLFTQTSYYWSNYHIQIRPRGGSGWTDLAMEDYFRLEPFGHRTRLTRILNDAFDQPHREVQRAEAARWIKGKYESLYPAAQSIAELRFVAQSFFVGEKLASQSGAWERSFSPEEGGPRQRVWIVSTHGFE